MSALAMSLDERMDAIDNSPPRTRRRHSLATASHKNLRNDAPQYYESLQKIWASTDVKKLLADARPESPSDVDARVEDGAEKQATANLETLAKQTLDDLFAEEPQHDMKDAKRRHTLGGAPQFSRAELKGLTKGRDPLASHPFLDAHDVLRRTKQPKVSPPPSPRGRSASASGAASSSSLEAAASWLQALAKRKASSTTKAVKAPPGWTPTVNTAIAVLKLRKLHEARAAGDEAAEAVLEETSEAEAVEELARLADPTDPSFDVLSFVEECWIAQALTDPARNDTILRGAYDDPAAMETAHSYTAEAWAPPPNDPWASVPMPMASSPYGVVFAPQPQQPQQMQPQQMQQMHTAQMSFGAAPSPSTFGFVPHVAHQPVPQVMHQSAPYAVYGNMAQHTWQPAPAQPMAMAPAAAPMAASWGAWQQQQPLPQQQQQPQPVGFRHGSLVAMAQEQEGSRLLQQQLGAMSPLELAAAVDELGPHLPALATNAFGNYLVSSMAALPLAYGAVHTALSGHVCRLMAHPQGSRVVQAAVQKLPTQMVGALVAELEGRVSEIAAGTHGSWSVVAAYKATHAPFIARELAGDIVRLATQQNGSRVVQRVLAEAASGGADVMGMVGALLIGGARSVRGLAEDRFGNYVVQLAIKHAHPAQQAQLVESLLPAFGMLAVSKCGSNVAEVVVQHASARQLLALREAIGQRDADVLRAHMYGAYVMNALEARFASAAA